MNIYSRGLGTRHLLGGMDSSSRLVKVAFTLAHAPKSDDETESVTNLFNILHSVEQAKRLDEIEPGKVVGTNPQVGRTVKEGTEITIIIAKESGKVTLENYVGMTYKTVEANLKNAGLSKTVKGFGKGKYQFIRQE